MFKCRFHAKIFPRSRRVRKNPPDEKKPRINISSLEEGGISGGQGFKASGRAKSAVSPAKKSSY